MKWIFALFIFIILQGKGQGVHHASYFGGAWIPVNLSHKTIDTYFIYDTSVVVITGVEGKVDDSLVLFWQKGLRIRKGRLRKVSGSKMEFSTRVILRSGIFANTDTINNVKEMAVDDSNDFEPLLKINGHQYRRGFLYTQESKDSIYGIIHRLIPRLEPNENSINK